MSPSNAASFGAVPTQPALEEAAAGAGVLPDAGLSDPASLAAAEEVNVRRRATTSTCASPARRSSSTRSPT
eukprot:6376216-Prymnesium_polylepis.1